LKRFTAEYSLRGLGFLHVYILEAHAADTWPIGYMWRVPQHKSMSERAAAAHFFLTSLAGYPLPIVLDGIDIAFEEAFAAWPSRFYIVDSQGVLRYKPQPTRDCAYSLDQLRTWLETVLPKATTTTTTATAIATTGAPATTLLSSVPK